MRAGLLALAVAAASAGGCGGPPPVRVVPPLPSSPPAAASPSPAGTATPAPPAPHVMVIVLENREYGAVIGSPAAPAINALARRYGLATSVYATTHPSLPNYLELIAGTTFGITGDCTDCDVEGITIADQLASRGVGWRAYMEGMPAPCYAGASSAAGYARKHDPFIYVTHLRASSACQNIVPYSRLAGDLSAGATPPFTLVVPNLCDDGHDCSTTQADAWVRTALAPVMQSSWYAAGGTVIITWDEGSSTAGCCGGAHGGHVATVVVDAAVRPGTRLDTPVAQAGILRTLEVLYGVAPLRDAACACSGDLLPLFGR